MIITFGTRLYGTIERCGGTYVATRFFHIMFLPLVPLQTQIVLGSDAREGSYRFIPARYSGRSILAAYLRTWGLLLGVWTVLNGISSFAQAIEFAQLDHPSTWGDLLMAPLRVFAATAVVAAAFYSLGRLSPARREQHEAYARFVGEPVDVARLSERRVELRAAVTEALREGSLALGLLGYRGEDGGVPDYLALALSPAVRDLAYLESALTLARLDESDASGPRRHELSQRHAAIAARLHEVREATGQTVAPPISLAG